MYLQHASITSANISISNTTTTNNFDLRPEKLGSQAITAIERLHLFMRERSVPDHLDLRFTTTTMAESTRNDGMDEEIRTSSNSATSAAIPTTGGDEVVSCDLSIIRRDLSLEKSGKKSLSPESDSKMDYSALSLTGNASISQGLETQDDAQSRETQQALVEQFGKLKSPAEVIEFVTKSPMEFQKLFTSISRMNERLTDRNDQLTNRVESLSQRIEVSEASDGMFCQFSKLPIEIRSMIWKFASDVPRLIRLGCVTVRRNGRKTTDFRLNSYPKKVPAVLHASSESRLQALKSYELCHEATKSGKSRYFNHEHDILYIDSATFGHTPMFYYNEQWPDRFPNHDGFFNSKLQRLAFDFSSWAIDAIRIIYGTGMYHNLKEIVLIDDAIQGCDSTSSFVIIHQHEDDYLSLDDWDCPLELLQTSQFKGRVESQFEYEARDDYSEDDEKRTNPWLEEGKEPPNISIMKMLPTSSLDLRSPLQIQY